MKWFLLALFGAVFWGIHYPLLEKALKILSPLTLVFFCGLSMTIVSGILLGTNLLTDLKIISNSNFNFKLLLLGVFITEFLALYFVNTAISINNSTYVSLIEISYPIFVILFSWLLFKESHINTSVIIGGLLVITGISVLILGAHSPSTDNNINIEVSKDSNLDN
jgi:drug/metabolite transporter (DMT)-like permease